MDECRADYQQKEAEIRVLNDKVKHVLTTCTRPGGGSTARSRGDFRRRTTVNIKRNKVFVESLNKCFEGVCKLDFVFHADKVQYFLNELVMGGLVLETSVPEIVVRFEEQVKQVQQESGLSAAPQRAVSAMKDFNVVTVMASSVLPNSITAKFSTASNCNAIVETSVGSQAIKDEI